MRETSSSTVAVTSPARATSAPRRAVDAPSRPTLVFFYSPTSGGSRRVDGFLSQVLQRRRNHETFSVRRVDYETHEEIAVRLGVEQSPALVVIDEKRVRARLERPRGCAEITNLLAPWLK